VATSVGVTDFKASDDFATPENPFVIVPHWIRHSDIFSSSPDTSPGGY
jgi:hypothetical protein